MNNDVPQYKTLGIEFEGDLTLVKVVVFKDFEDGTSIDVSCRMTIGKDDTRTLSQIQDAAISYAKRLIPTIPNPKNA